MDALALLVGVGLFFVFPVYLLVKARRVSQLETRLAEEIRRIDGRLDSLSEGLVALREALGDAGRTPAAKKTRSAAREPEPGHGHEPTSEESARPAWMEVAVAKAAHEEVRGHGARTSAREAETSFKEAVRQAAERSSPAQPVEAPPPEVAAAPKPARKPAALHRHPETVSAHSSADLEEALGTNWLNKLGALLLVVGVAFFLMYQLRSLGPAGKDLLGASVGVSLLAGGLVAERRARYQMFSRGAMAAGWGIVFFTAFALYHIDAARVLQSQVLGLVCMLAVAAGMVGHALRYRSQVVTGLALAFGFLTVVLSHDTAFTLSATAVLALASMVIVVRMRWMVLEVFAVLATYANHALWLLAREAAEGGPTAAEMHRSLALLVVYWLIFRIAYVARRSLSTDEEQQAAFSAFLNTMGAVLVASRQPYEPALLSGVLAVLAAVDAGLAMLIRARRFAFVLLCTLAAVAIAAAVPMRLSGQAMSYAWLFEAEALIVLGVVLRDGLFTRLGVIGTGAAAAHAGVTALAAVLDVRGVADAGGVLPDAALLCVAGAATLFANGLWLIRARPAAFTEVFERIGVMKLTYLGSVLLGVGAWALVSNAWVALAWLAIGCGLLPGGPAPRLARPLARGAGHHRARGDGCRSRRVLGRGVGRAGPSAAGGGPGGCGRASRPLLAEPSARLPGKPQCGCRPYVGWLGIPGRVDLV